MDTACLPFNCLNNRVFKLIFFTSIQFPFSIRLLIHLELSLASFIVCLKICFSRYFRFENLLFKLEVLDHKARERAGVITPTLASPIPVLLQLDSAIEVIR